MQLETQGVWNMSDYSRKDILIYILKMLGHKSHMLDLVKHSECDQAIVNYIKHKISFTKDIYLITFVEYFL